MPGMKPTFCGFPLLVLLLCGLPSAQGISSPHEGVPQARMNPDPVRLNVIDGDDIRFLRLSGVERLSQNRVNQIVQDDQGFMWFATQHGVDRYDGYEFRLFKNDPAQPNSPCGVLMLSLFKDRSGTLWMGCEHGLDRFEPTTEAFVHYEFDPGTTDVVRHISEDPSGMLWLSTGHGLGRLDPHSRKITWFRHNAGDPLSLSSDDVKSTGSDRRGGFWVATGGGLDAFDPNTGRVTFHVELAHEPHELSFYEDRHGVFWILSASGNGLAVFDRESGIVTPYLYATELSGTPLTGVIQMLEDRDGNLWIGTLSDGLLRLDRENAKVIRYRNDPASPDSLPENRITTLLEDREGDIWVGFGALPPILFTPRPPPFKSLPFDSGNRANLGERLVDVIFQDRQGALWIGTTGALDRCDSTGRRCTHFDVPGRGVASDVLSVAEDTSGNFWVGTSGQGLCRFDRIAGKCQALFRHANQDPSSISNDTVSYLLIGHDGALWAGTGDGLSKFDPVTERFTVYRNESSANSAGQMWSMVEDSDGNLWIGTEGSGILRFDRRTQRLRQFAGPQSGVAAVSSPYVSAVYIDRVNRLWAGTLNGLDRIDMLTGRRTRYAEDDGLASTKVACILEHAGGDLWLSTDKGISKFNPRTGVFQNFSVADGVPGDLTGYSACVKGANGEMFFGGFAGATRFRPDQVSTDSYSPPAVLTAFDLFGAPVSIRPGSPLQQVIGFTKELALAHNQNSFSFQFAALSFRSPSTSRYRYKLEGLEQSWHEVGGDRRYAAYTSLPAGTYRFRVQGATNRGPWSEPGVAVSIAISPAWWATWWFQTLLVSAAPLATLWLYSLRARQLHHRFAAQLKARESERTRVARELHDTLLQSFQGLLLRFQVAYELLPARPTEAKHDLGGAIDRTVRAISEGRAAVQGLRASAVEDEDLDTAIKTLAEELASDRYGNEGVVLRLNVQGTPRPLRPIARDEIFQIAGEALRNARRHAQASAIEVELHYDERQVRLRVRDNGKGIGPRFLSGESTTGHYGLAGMRERGKLLGGELSICSAPASGSEVELTVPAARVYATTPSKGLGWLLRKLLGKIAKVTYE